MATSASSHGKPSLVLKHLLYNLQNVYKLTDKEAHFLLTSLPWKCNSLYMYMVIYIIAIYMASVALQGIYTL